ncbi:hypothetical protein [Vibrio splendidus]|uniref:hypothetical protein n=1 Tax=Vibrio splendidus TaxID=29497 RepID=UPI0015E7C4C7|nr:hypothetical protein [Vibrio splendidus]
MDNESANVQPVSVPDVGDEILPYNDLTPDGFEHLLYAIYKDQLTDEGYYSLVTLMITGADKGRDVWLTKGEVPTGLIQCKRESKGFDVKKTIKEIIKFLLFAHIEPALLPNPSVFQYTLALSSDPASTTVDFFTTPKSWLESNADSLDSEIGKVITQYKSFSELRVADVSMAVKNNLKSMKYELIRPLDLNGLLHQSPVVKKRFFRTNVPVTADELSKSVLSLLYQALPPSLMANNNLTVSRKYSISSVDEVPLPKAIASRSQLVSNVKESLHLHRTAWMYGGAGVGKTILAKMVAKELGGEWTGINLRGLSVSEVCLAMGDIVSALGDRCATGILIDDLECPFDQILVEKLAALWGYCLKTNIHLLFTSSKQVDLNYLFEVDLTKDIEQKVGDFSESDIAEILFALGVTEKYWAKYIHLSSGGGHPQLAFAVIQSMKTNNWNVQEFRSLNSLFNKNEAVENIRKKTRERLLGELPNETRHLAERISLIGGRFTRNLVLDLAQLPPSIDAAGIVFEQLIGSWVDQHGADRFSLSPLLNNLAKAMLTESQQKEVHYGIANSLTAEKTLDPTMMNSAFISAWVGENTSALTILSFPFFTSTPEDLCAISPYLMAFCLLGTDGPIYKKDMAVSRMLRGAQVILLCCSDGKKSEFLTAFNQFEQECNDVEENDPSVFLLRMAVYARLMLLEPKFGLLPNWRQVITKLDELIENQAELLPEELKKEELITNFEGIPAIGFLLLNLVHQIKSLDELIPVFEFLEACDQRIRENFFSALEYHDFGVDMLISGAWLKEYDEGTLDCDKHTALLSKWEELANGWGNIRLAICCLKYSAVILDETGGQGDKAISLIDAGLSKYDDSDYELLKGKAKVLYRAERYGESLLLAKKISGSNTLLDRVGTAFFYRDSAICAEHENDFSLACEYFMAGSYSAYESELPDMLPMAIGLKADASLANWHGGNREGCIRKLSEVLTELKRLKSDSSIKATHCHVTSRHILLWLEQEVTGEKRFTANDEEVKIYPGIVSNPNPSKDIVKKELTPLEMSWYMLASIENNGLLDVGVTSQIYSHLGGRPLIEGEWTLSATILDRSFIEVDVNNFIAAVKKLIAGLVFLLDRQSDEAEFKSQDFTYGNLSKLNEKDCADHSNTIEQFILCFVSCCAIRGEWEPVDRLIESLDLDTELNIRVDFMNALNGIQGDIDDSSIATACSLVSHRIDIKNGWFGTPIRLFQLALTTIQLANSCGKSRVVSQVVYEAMKQNWMVIWEHQRALLVNPHYHFGTINKAFSGTSYSWEKKALNLLMAILPVLGISNEIEVKALLVDLLRKSMV